MKIIAGVVIMAAKANNDGSNIKRSVEVALERDWSLNHEFWMFFGKYRSGSRGDLFDKVVGHHVSSCIYIPFKRWCFTRNI